MKRKNFIGKVVFENHYDYFCNSEIIYNFMNEIINFINILKKSAVIFFQNNIHKATEI